MEAQQDCAFSLLKQELNSWMTPSRLDLSPVPEVNSNAPSSSRLQIPETNGKATIITFLRHCGCPFAEKTFKGLRSTAEKYPEIKFIAVSHSDQASTENWLSSIGGKMDTQVIVDPEREIYAQWGLGVSSGWHVLNPWSLFAVWKLGKSDNIWNRPTESGSRWQTSGSFAVDAEGIIRWGGPAQSADSIPDFEEAMKALQVGT